MPEEPDADAVLDQIVEQDDRYARQAYCFLMEALHFTTSRLPIHRHVTGQELSWGIRDYAVEKYGIGVPLVFEQWGITRTRDFGEIVYNLVNAGLMRKTDEDSIEDFNDVFDFETEFVKKFEIKVDRSSL